MNDSRGVTEQEKSLHPWIEAWLESLDLFSLADWDVLVFMHRHRTSLANAEQISRLLGYTSEVVADSLDRLESQELVERSRASRGVRLYQFLDSKTSSPDGFEQLMSLAESREGRVLLTAKLRERANRRNERDSSSLRLVVVKGTGKWPEAV